MSNADFFTRLGLFVVKDFLNPELCARFRHEARLADGTQATVTLTGSEVVDESVRRTKLVKVSAATIASLEARLLALKPKLESHFNVALAGCQKPQFLVYKEGDFFQPHQDNSSELTSSRYLQERQMSMVIFLNRQVEVPEPDAYCGGSLALYGVIDDDPRWQTWGFPLVSQTGLLIAFRSDVLHEVKPVTYGERYTIVSWFF